MISRATSLFKALSDDTRLRIFRLFVISNDELCLCELTDALEISQYNVSRHLKILVAAGLLVRQKQGRWVYFRLNPQIEQEFPPLLTLVAALSDARLERDWQELQQRLRLRTNGRCTIGVQKKHLLGR